jgi:hypothetical protein
VKKARLAGRFEYFKDGKIEPVPPRGFGNR